MRRILFILAAFAWLAQAQAIDYELRTFDDSPVIFVGDNARTPAPGVPRRQFVTIQNTSRKTVTGVILEQSLTRAGKTEIIAMEHVTIVTLLNEKKRISFAVDDMTTKLKSPGDPPGKPVLSLVAVEFIDDSQWNAPTGSAHAGVDDSQRNAPIAAGVPAGVDGLRRNVPIDGGAHAGVDDSQWKASTSASGFAGIYPQGKAPTGEGAYAGLE